MVGREQHELEASLLSATAGNARTSPRLPDGVVWIVRRRELAP
jgi:hypothetical protein